jgi:DNA-binding transcriptional ArsR family regulator
MSRANEKSIRHAAAIFAALGDATRLSLVERLAKAKALSATALADEAKVTRQAIVKHLRVLEDSGVVSKERSGREVLYDLDVARLDDMRTFLHRISAGWDRAIEGCACRSSANSRAIAPRALSVTMTSAR